MAFSFKKMFGKEDDDEYLEIDVQSVKPEETKVMVKSYALRKFDDINDVLNGLREGFTIAVVDIKPLKTKDIIELKRAIAKIKKTVDALNGSIAGFGENIIIATPQFVQIQKTPSVQKEKEQRIDFINE